LGGRRAESLAGLLPMKQGQGVGRLGPRLGMARWNEEKVLPGGGAVGAVAPGVVASEKGSVTSKARILLWGVAGGEWEKR